MLLSSLHKSSVPRVEGFVQRYEVKAGILYKAPLCKTSWFVRRVTGRGMALSGVYDIFSRRRQITAWKTSFCKDGAYAFVSHSLTQNTS